MIGLISGSCLCSSYSSEIHNSKCSWTKRELWWKHWFLFNDRFSDSIHLQQLHIPVYEGITTFFCRKYMEIQLHIQNFRPLTPLTLIISCWCSAGLSEIAFSANSGFMCASMVKNSCVLVSAGHDMSPTMDESNPVDQSGGYLPQKNTRLLWFRTFMNFPNDSPLSERTGFGEIFRGSSHW